MGRLLGQENGQDQMHVPQAGSTFVRLEDLGVLVPNSRRTHLHPDTTDTQIRNWVLSSFVVQVVEVLVI